MMSTGPRSPGATTAGDEIQQKVPVALAGENWRVEKRRLETNKEIEDLYDDSIAKCLDMNAVANQKALDAYNQVYSKIKHTSPPLPITHSKLGKKLKSDRAICDSETLYLPPAYLPLHPF